MDEPVIDRLLPYYARELDALRTLAGRFADAHPSTAARLRISRDTTDDPHVERLLEGVAFLTARVQQRLDDEFPEITDALLGVLHPHVLAPVPSASIVRFEGLPTQRARLRIPAGTTLVADPVDGEPCRFHTTQAVDLWPLVVESARLSAVPVAAPVGAGTTGAKAVLRIALRLTDATTRFADLGLDSLRLFLSGPTGLGARLHELLCNGVVAVALADGPNDDRPTMLPPGAIQPAGFADDEALLPHSARRPSWLRLLTEYFALPEKFLFADLAGLDARTLVQTGDRLEIFIYLDRTDPGLERAVDAAAIGIGCTPVINLFRRGCEPIRVDGRTTEYPIVADARRPQSFEIWSVEDVREIGRDGAAHVWRPFYHHRAHPGVGAVGSYLVARRDTAGPDGGSDVLLLPADERSAATRPAEAVLTVDALCTNRDLAARLPFGGASPALHIAQAGATALATVICLMPFTAPGRTPLRQGRGRALVSHVSLGHLSVVDGPAAAAALREILSLYDMRRSAATRAAIDSLTDMRVRDATARVPGARVGSFARGLDVELVFDPAAWQSGGLFVLAAVLERVLALHATVNAFVRTRVSFRGVADPIARFPPRAGTRTLL